MPVSIYRTRPGNEEIEDLAWLCDDEWELTPQVEAIKDWLKGSAENFVPDEYVANISFKWRRDAATGGPVLDPGTLRKMAELGMSLYLSEFSGFAGEDETAVDNS